MKRWLTKALVLAVATFWVAGSVLGQPFTKRGSGVSAYNSAPTYPLISGFESIEEDSVFWGQYGFWDPDNACADPATLPCWDHNTPTQRDIMEYDLYTNVGGTDAPQGNDAIWMDWSVFSDNDWGGSSALQHLLPDSVAAAGNFYDFSDFLEIGISYNTLARTSGSAASTFFRIKINEGSDSVPSEGTEDWYSEDQVMLQDEVGWKETFIPLETVPGCCGTTGFNRPGWSGITGNDQFDMDKIVGFQLEFVAPSEASTGDRVVAGTTVWDNFRVRGVRYNLMTSFEGMPTSDGKQSTAGTYTLSTSSDAILDDGSLQVDYSVVGDQGWGGEVDLFFQPDGAENFGDMSARTAVTVFYKVLTPASAGMNFGLRVFENSDGNESIWNYEQSDVLTDESGQWRRFVAPFSAMEVPGWCNCAHDGILDRSKITQIQFVLYTGETNTAVGSILFDRMTGYGFQETDNTAPDAVAGLAVATSDYANLITWADVPGETGETYTIYVSDAPITDVATAGILADGVAEGTEVYSDPLYYPVADGPTTFYYAIAAKDEAGNVSEAAVFGSPVTNNGRGLATINLGAPAGFVADGAVGEWSDITPIHMEDGTPIGHVVYDTPGDAEDLSADAYLAMGPDNFYFALEVFDDEYDPVPDVDPGDKWLYDGGEMYIGLYDGRGGEHAGFEGGNTPDFKFYLYKQDFRSDQIESPIFLDGDGNYKWTQTATGYIVEGMIPFATMKRDDGDLFVPMNGMRLPLDIVVMDDDTVGGGLGNRETVFAYSADNDDNSYQSPQNWFYTWIGDQYDVVTGVESIAGDVPGQYQLHANYPNPFNPTTMFRYELPQSGRVTLKVFNMLGQEIQTLVNTDQAAGTYEVGFDATNLTSGVYLYSLQSGNFVQTRKMILVR